MWTTLIFFAVMILVFYLLIIRPQQKQRKKQEHFLQALKVGDKVVTSSGVIGRIVSISGNIVTLEIAKDVRARVLKPYVLSLFSEEGEQQKQS
jgi:preprotein translocase subunit YajC